MKTTLLLVAPAITASPLIIPSVGGVARSAGWVSFPNHNPPQRLSALAHPERGLLCRFHELWCSAVAWTAPVLMAQDVSHCPRRGERFSWHFISRTLELAGVLGPGCGAVGGTNRR